MNRISTGLKTIRSMKPTRAAPGNIKSASGNLRGHNYKKLIGQLFKKGATLKTVVLAGAAKKKIPLSIGGAKQIHLSLGVTKKIPLPPSLGVKKPLPSVVGAKKSLSSTVGAKKSLSSAVGAKKSLSSVTRTKKAMKKKLPAKGGAKKAPPAIKIPLVKMALVAPKKRDPRAKFVDGREAETEIKRSIEILKIHFKKREISFHTWYVMSTGEDRIFFKTNEEGDVYIQDKRAWSSYGREGISITLHKIKDEVWLNKKLLHKMEENTDFLRVELTNAMNVTNRGVAWLRDPTNIIYLITKNKEGTIELQEHPKHDLKKVG